MFKLAANCWPNQHCLRKEMQWLSLNDCGGRCSILTRRWSRASYNVTDAGTCLQLSEFRGSGLIVFMNDWMKYAVKLFLAISEKKRQLEHWILVPCTLKEKKIRNYFNFVAFVQLKMYEINFDTKFLPPGLLALRLPLLVFISFCQFESTKLNSIRKVLDGKVRNFSPTKNFFFYSYVLCIVLSLATETIWKWRLLFQSPFPAVIYSLDCFFSFRKKRFFFKKNVKVKYHFAAKTKAAKQPWWRFFCLLLFNCEGFFTWFHKERF